MTDTTKINTAIRNLENFELTENEEFIEIYHDFLNECEPEFEKYGDYAEYLKENDNTAYRVGMNDYADSFIRDDNHKQLDEYTDLVEELEEALEDYKQAIMDEWE